MNLFMPFSAFLITFAIGLMVRRIVLRQIERYAANTQTRFDDIVVDAIRMPLALWFLMFSIYLGMKVSAIPGNIVDIAAKLLGVLGIISVTLSGKRDKLITGKIRQGEL